MAASTAGMVVFKNRKTGNARAEYFTFTGAAKVTWASNGQTHILTAPEGEFIVDIQFNNDGVTTITNFKLLVDGQDIRNRYLMVLFAADSTMPTRLVCPVEISGNKQLQLETLA